MSDKDAIEQNAEYEEEGGGCCDSITNSVIYQKIMGSTTKAASRTSCFYMLGITSLASIPMRKNSKFVYTAFFIAMILYALYFVFFLGVKGFNNWKYRLHSQISPALIWLPLLAIFINTFIPVKFFEYLYYFYCIGFVLYAICQSMLIVNMAYSLVRHMHASYEEGNDAMQIIVLITTGIFYLMTIVLGGTCIWKNKALHDKVWSSLNLAINLILTIISLVPTVKQYNTATGIFQSSLVSFYSTLLVTFGVIAYSNDISQDESPLRKYYNWFRVAIVTIGIISLSYYAFAGFSEGDDDDIEANNAGSTFDAKYANMNEDEEEEEEAFVHSNSLFNFVMALASCYIALTITKFRKDIFVTGPADNMTVPYLVYGSLIFCGVAVQAVYAFTLFAPMIFRDREFDFAK